MVLKLPRSPTPKQEFAHDYWVDRLADHRCEYCEDWIDLADVVGSERRGYFCSELCFHLKNDSVQEFEVAKRF